MTIRVSLAMGRKAPVNPALVQVSRAVATVTPGRFGTNRHVGDVTGPKGARVTVIVDWKKRSVPVHASSLSGSVTVWLWTVLVSSGPAAGWNVVKPAAIHAARAPAIDMPTTLGTVRQPSGGAGGGGPPVPGEQSTR